jgi:hypothetical protein
MDALAGSGVVPATCRAFAWLERPETGDLHLVAVEEGGREHTH